MRLGRVPPATTTPHVYPAPLEVEPPCRATEERPHAVRGSFRSTGVRRLACRYDILGRCRNMMPRRSVDDLSPILGGLCLAILLSAKWRNIQRELACRHSQTVFAGARCFVGRGKLEVGADGSASRPSFLVSRSFGPLTNARPYGEGRTAGRRRVPAVRSRHPAAPR